MINFKVRTKKKTLSLKLNCKRIFKDLVFFELWDEDPFFIANENLGSAISITGSHWLGSGSIWINYH